MSRPYKSVRQREKERKQRHRRYAERSHASYLEKKKRRPRRRNVTNYRILTAFFGFIATSLATLILLPFALADWGYKSARIRKNRIATGRAGRASAQKGTATVKKKAQKPPRRAAASHKATAERRARGTQRTPSAATAPSQTLTDTTAHVSPTEAHLPSPCEREQASTRAKVDEGVPKSVPKHAADQYIKKRMIIAGTSYCDADALSTLRVGTYIQLVPEPTNIHDKDAIVLVYNEKKIGYVAREDNVMLSVGFKLGRQIYGVITDIFTENGRSRYEYETWFAS